MTLIDENLKVYVLLSQVIVSRKTDCITLLESLQAEPVAVDDWEILVRGGR